MKKDRREGTGNALIIFITASSSSDILSLWGSFSVSLCWLEGWAGWLDIPLPHFITICYVKAIRPHRYTRTHLTSMILDLKMVEYWQFGVVQSDTVIRITHKPLGKPARAQSPVKTGCFLDHPPISMQEEEPSQWFWGASWWRGGS